MEHLQYKLLGRETSSWQKKYLFHEVGRSENADSAFILLLATARKRPGEAPEAPGAPFPVLMSGELRFAPEPQWSGLS